MRVTQKSLKKLKRIPVKTAKRVEVPANYGNPCLACDNGRRLPADENMVLTMEGHSAQVWCRVCGRCLQA